MIIQAKSNVSQLHSMNIKGKGAKGVIWGVGGSTGDHYKLVQMVAEAIAPEAEHTIVMFSGNVINDMKIINEINPDVVNLSWTGLNFELYVQMYHGIWDVESNKLYSDIVDEFFTHYNIAAAGNSATEENLFPAADDRFLSVGACWWNAMSKEYRRKSYQTKNANVDLVNFSGYDIDNDGDYEEGTSFATPYTYGEALLLRSMKGRRLEFWEYNNYFRSICVKSPDEFTGWGCPEMKPIVNHEMLLEYDSAIYYVDGVEKRNKGLINGKIVDVPIFFVFGRTQISLDMFEKLSEEYNDINNFVGDWSNDDPKHVKITFNSSN